METVRSADRERYLAALYAPADKRDALLALYAFNAEIAGIRDKIREALPGEMRLQWWRDVISGTGSGAGQPVAEALLDAIRTHRLPEAAFQNMLDARIFDLYDDPMPSRTDLEGYCGETAGALLQLAALILDPGAAPGVAERAGHAGCAQAITGLLRLLPQHRRRGRCFVPRDLLAAVGTTPEEFVAGEGGPQASRAVEAMAALAGEHLAAFEARAGKLPEKLRPAFLPVALCRSLLARMAGDPEAALTRHVDLPSWRKHWLYFRHAARGWQYL